MTDPAGGRARPRPAREPGRGRRGVAPAAVVVVALGLLVAACSTATGTDTATGGAGTTTGTSPGSTAPVGTPAPGSVPATEPPTTTTEAPTTTAPALPSAAPIVAKAPRPRPPTPPGRLQPPEDLPLPGPPVIADEGRWEPFGPAVGGSPVMYATKVRADAAGTYYATAVWIDSSAVRGELFPGTDEPGGTWSVAGAVPGDQVPQLVAAFNGGFLLREAQGGFYKDNTIVDQLVDGTASLVFYKDGTMALGAWNRDVSMTDDVVGVRQNLPLLVDGHKVNPSATDTDTKVWGRTWGSMATPWRSALGVRDDGSFVYFAGPALSARALGNNMATLGSGRAMALDLNPEWVTFNAYSNGVGTKFHELQAKPASRYLTLDLRDFVALFARR